MLIKAMQEQQATIEALTQRIEDDTGEQLMTTNTWTISQCDRELSDGGITTAHWRVNAEQTVGRGND